MHRTIYLKTTESCNLSCKHCFTGGNIPKREFWDTNRIIDWITRCLSYFDQNDSFHFEFHGGEPMLAPISSLKEVYNHIRSFNRNNISIGMTTNLVYKLNPEKIEFLKNLDGLGTSWDPDIRFTKESQLGLWKKNVKQLMDLSIPLSLFISVSKGLVGLDQEEVLGFVKEMGFKKIHFERITNNGNAVDNQSLFPSNQEINDWYMRLHHASEKLNIRKDIYISSLEDVYKKFESFNFCSGTFCRDCQEKLFTINQNGSIAGCPNSAPTDYFGHISQDIVEMLMSDRRLNTIIAERNRNPLCYGCPVFQYCGSDCHKLDWQGDVCPAPKSLMLHLKKQKDEFVNARLQELSGHSN